VKLIRGMVVRYSFGLNFTLMLFIVSRTVTAFRNHPASASFGIEIRRIASATLGRIELSLSATTSDPPPSDGVNPLHIARGRKEKRARTKPELVSNTLRPPIIPLKFANVKSAQIFELPDLNFDTVIDVRTPAEYEIDHIPGSINCPVLNNEERVIIGTLHNGNNFEARRQGAALISRHVAELLENEFKDKPKTWRPLIYCWRGGLRSGSLAIVMAQVGWQVYQLNGGYKSYRTNLMEILPVLCEKCILKVVSAPTGSGKTHFLAALKRAGKQVIDLESLAEHRGSVLGDLPGQKQPSQRLFDTRLLVELQKLDLEKPIYIESESRKIGNIALPQALIDRMHDSECVVLEVSLSDRVNGLCEDYKFFCENPEILIKQLTYLSNIRSKDQLDEWASLARSGLFPELVRQLLEVHYDPLYWKSLRKNYPQIDDEMISQKIRASGISPSSLDDAVSKIVEKDNVRTLIDNFHAAL
jgi:tRNA 2-selenouridine synthase